MRMVDHTANDCCKKSLRERCAGGVVGSLHGSNGSRMNRNKSNRGRGREKRRQARDLRWPPPAAARQLQVIPARADRRPGADPRGYRTMGERSAQQPQGLCCRLARRARRAMGTLTWLLDSRVGHLPLHAQLFQQRRGLQTYAEVL